MFYDNIQIVDAHYVWYKNIIGKDEMTLTVPCDPVLQFVKSVLFGIQFFDTAPVITEAKTNNY